MQRWKNYWFNISLLLNSLLVFLLLFENKISIPLWLQVGGRMHPLMLHFPIALIVLYAITSLIMSRRTNPAENDYKNVSGFFLGLVAVLTVITTLMGLFLSQEEGYDPEALRWHKWGGVSLSLFTLLWLGFARQLHSRKPATVFCSVLALGLVIITGHQGAVITHGEDYLLAPVTPETEIPDVDIEDAVVYTHMIRPILEAKCMSCHNSKKAKGELVMETETLLLKGGKNGVLWDSTADDFGLMLRRIHLPLDEKKHMPPKGKTQLTDEEIEILLQWIRKGPDFTTKVVDLQPGDTLRLLAEKIFTAGKIENYVFAAADASVIMDLNTVNRVVSSEAIGSPALWVNFFNKNLYQPVQLSELDKIKKQIVSLDLSQMPVKDDELKIIAGFENLRTLNLSFTDITGSGLEALQKLKYLRNLSLSGTKVNAEQLKQLKNFAALEKIFAWNVSVTPAEMQALQQKFSDIHFETGAQPDTTKLKLSMPVLLNEERFLTNAIPLKLKHYVPGAVIRYTLDGSEPDSIHSPVYRGSETINTDVTLKVKAYKPGWISSDMLEAGFSKTAYKADSFFYTKRPDTRYDDTKHTMLIDLEQGQTDFRAGGWVGFRENRMEAVIGFAKPVELHAVTLSSLIDIGSYIMPAQSVEVWASDDGKNFRRLARLVPEQPTVVAAAYRKAFVCSFNATTAKFIRIIATPVGKLPAWHPGKGDKGWIFADEILFN